MGRSMVQIDINKVRCVTWLCFYYEWKVRGRKYSKDGGVDGWRTETVWPVKTQQLQYTVKYFNNIKTPQSITDLSTAAM